MAGDMSSMSQIEESTAGSSNQEKNEERPSAVVAICLGCLLIGTLLGLLFLVVSNVISGGDGHEESETKDSALYAQIKPGSPPAKESPAPPTTSTDTPGQNEREGYTTPEEAKPRTLPTFTLICTVHFEPDRKWTQPPRDKMCDFLFYDSLFQLIVPGYNESGNVTDEIMHKDILVNLAKNVYKHTRIGISVEISRLADFRNYIHSEKGKRDLDEYNKVLMRDWSILNIHQLRVRFYNDDLKAAFEILKEMADFQESQKVDAYMIMGLYLENESLCDQAAGYMNTIFTPHGIISLGHNSLGASEYPYAIGWRHSIPTNSDIDPRTVVKNITFGHYLGQAVQAVRCLQSKGVKSMFAVSVTLAPILTEICIETFYMQDRLFMKCARGDFRQPLQEVCHNESYTEHVYNEDYLSAFHFSLYGSQPAIFDMIKSFKPKVCKNWADTKNLSLGISIHDINYDTFWQNGPNSNATPEDCPRDLWDGEWARTNYLLKFREFLIKDSELPEQKENFTTRCQKIT